MKPERAKRIVSYTAKELAKMKSRSNWAKAAAMTNEQIEASIAADPDEAGFIPDWSTATIEMPKPPTKDNLHMRIDRDVLAFFRKFGKGYQTRINAVLRSYMSSMTRNGRSRSK